MHAGGQSRAVLSDDAATVGGGVGLGGILHRVVNDQQVGTEAGHAGVDAGRQQPARAALDPPPTHGRLVRRQPETEVVRVLGDQLAGFAAVGLGQFVAIADQHDLEVGTRISAQTTVQTASRRDLPVLGGVVTMSR